MSGPGKSKPSRATETTLGIADRIRSVRFRFDRTQAQFAALVGVAVDRVRDWELGEGIGRSDLVRIADGTGASLTWLISGLNPARIEAIRVEASQWAPRLRPCADTRASGEADSDGPVVSWPVTR